VIKELEKAQKKLSSELVDSALTSLHQISLKLIQKEPVEVFPACPKPAKPKLQIRSKSSLKTASEQLDLYILNNC
jgi:CRISPR/Cas system endoribonuclease Cas6 (RAMP superfamily)